MKNIARSCQNPSCMLLKVYCPQTRALFCIQADMPTPITFAPISLPRQTSPAYDSQPSYSTNITADAALQSSDPVTAHQSGASTTAAQYNSANNIVTAQYSSSSTATAAMLSSLRPQHGVDVPLGATDPPSKTSEDQQQSEQQTRATATSQR